MFYLALYFATIAAAAIGAILFLGGWQPPIAALGFIPGWVWMTGKTTLLVLVFMWLRGTLPRLRADQLMAFAWKVLVPLTLANLLVTGLLGKLLKPVEQQSGPEVTQKRFRHFVAGVATKPQYFGTEAKQLHRFAATPAVYDDPDWNMSDREREEFARLTEGL